MKDEIFTSVRAGFGQGLIDAARENPRVVALAADLRDSVGFGDFAKEFPERFVEVGIAEQNLVTVASGMAAMGTIPFAASYAAFSPGRNYEQIRTTIALNNQPVKIVATHAGLNVGADGATHQMLEDIAIMRSLPNMVVLAPASANEARAAAIAMARDNRPNYVRMPRGDMREIFPHGYEKFDIGLAHRLREGCDITLAATGTMTALALDAADELAKQNISAEVLHSPTIKPLDEQTLLNSVRKTGKIITVEEHQVAGGFGSAITEVLAQNLPMPIKIIGINDQFGQSGTQNELWEYYGLTKENILRNALKIL